MIIITMQQPEVKIDSLQLRQDNISNAKNGGIGMRQVSTGILELDVHNMTRVQAQAAIDAKLRRPPVGIYRLRIIHGYHGGTVLKELAQSYKKHPKVIRVEMGLNPGSTDLVLREFV